ncbi:unnamed protein product [Acanthoscelides obtectus]|uniref:BRCT domain-containing protein n=1 Tax=Acanthoscelides obtectus TaxID=200917 RepID=A0A9P0VTX3_ACAOB|nr:unnamed protein product [Acanthoscelides obtectus]CAK1682639.1 hypothetical protein AOBTE_LOCUS33752 [Acanthoscelides obtectus]
MTEVLLLCNGGEVTSIDDISCTHVNLTTCPDGTPLGAQKRPKKNLFTRTFSSSKFSRKSRKTLELNATQLSFGEPSAVDGKDKLNASCFPDISLNPVPTNNHKLSCDIAGASRRTSVAAVAVVDESTVADRLEGPAKAWVVKAEWFWTSVQKEISLGEKEYLFDDVSNF